MRLGDILGRIEGKEVNWLEVFRSIVERRTVGDANTKSVDMKVTDIRIHDGITEPTFWISMRSSGMKSSSSGIALTIAMVEKRANARTDRENIMVFVCDDFPFWMMMELEGG